MRFSDEDIRFELDRNLGWLREEDKPGVEGGLYESLFVQRDEDTYVPPRPEVTRNPSEYNVNIPRKTISQPERDSLKMTPGQAFIGKTASGVGTAKRTRKRVRQTTDLQRSLNIS